MKTGKLRHKILLFTLPLTLIPFTLASLAVYYFVVRSYQLQMDEEQNKLLAEAIAGVRKEQETARKDVLLLASLPTTVDYLEWILAGKPDKAQSRQASMRTVLQMFFDQSPYYLRLRLVDAQGLERIKLSKVPGDDSLALVTNQEFFKRTLIRGQLQMPAESVQPGRVVSLFACSVRREAFYGMVVLDLNTAVFERLFRPLLRGHRLATFLFDDRGVVLQRALDGPATESWLGQTSLAAEAQNLLAKPRLELFRREVAVGGKKYLLSILHAEEFIEFIEPVAGEHWFLGVLQPKERTLEQARAFQAIFAVILAGAVVAVLWSARRYSRRIAVPLEQVAQATGEIARGKFDIKLDVATGDEVEELARAVRRMAEDLRGYQSEIVRTAKLATIGEMASEVAHEFQNRLSGMSVWIQILDAEMDANDPRHAYLEEVKQGLKTFTGLLASMKQVYKTPILSLSDVDLNRLVRDSLPYVKESVEAKEITVALELAGALPTLRCDAEKIQSVILNLLMNAVEAVEAGGRIKIRTSFEEQAIGGVVILAVTDNGCGIGDKDLPRIFYPFYSTKPGGSGLGLAISSNIVSAHRGSIGVQSELGRGSTFTLSIPSSGTDRVPPEK